jgi:hypothetical protein
MKHLPSYCKKIVRKQDILNKDRCLNPGFSICRMITIFDVLQCHKRKDISKVDYYKMLEMLYSFYIRWLSFLWT